MFELAPQLAPSCDVTAVWPGAGSRWRCEPRAHGEQDERDVNLLANEVDDYGFSLRQLLLGIVRSRPFLRE